MSIIASARFEQSDFSEFDSRVTSNVASSFVSGLAGSGAALQTIGGGASSHDYGVKAVSITSEYIRARYYLNDSGCMPSSAEVVSFLTGWAGASIRMYDSIRYDGSNNVQYTVYLRQDDLSYKNTVTFTYEHGEHYLEYWVQRATGPSAADGQLGVSIDGVTKSLITNVQLSTLSRPSSFRFGLQDGDQTPMTIILDELVVRDDDTTIGPYVPHNVQAFNQLRRRRRLSQ